MPPGGNEAEWLTRKKRIDTKLRSLNPVWQIIPRHECLDTTQPTHKLTPEQMQWLSLVRECLVKNLSMDVEDFDLTPLLAMRGEVRLKPRKCLVICGSW